MTNIDPPPTLADAVAAARVVVEHPESRHALAPDLVALLLARLDELEVPRDLHRFAWCFSHGTLHEFYGRPWCTADWVPLLARNARQALHKKSYIWGDAEFLHHLPNEQQMLVVSVASFRDKERS